ncbi:MAG: hypothetical protein ABT940_01110 [Alphaproteobacteria bacterium]
MRDDVILAIQGDRLPREFSAALEGSEAGAVYAVHIQKLSIEDAAEFLETRAKVQEGIAAIEAGHVMDEEEAYAEIECRIRFSGHEFALCRHADVLTNGLK